MRYKDKTNAEYMREYRAKNPEKIKLWASVIGKQAYDREHHQKNKEKRANYPSSQITYRREYREKNNDRINAYSRGKVEEKGKFLFQLMGNKCKNCGETDPMYLQIDHVKNDGYLDKNQSGSRICVKYKMKLYYENPKRFQLLCANCNFAKQQNGGKLYKPKKR